MKNENKARLLDKFIKDYPFKYETEYNLIYNARKYMVDDEYELVSELFNEYQDYIIDFFASEI